jgi:lambda repressor-like predicted transcriptional regulator
LPTGRCGARSSSANENLGGDDLDLVGRLISMPRQDAARVSPATVRRLKLQPHIIELRKSGLSWREVAIEIGLSHEYCRRLYTEAVNDFADTQFHRGVDDQPSHCASRPTRRRAQDKQEVIDEMLRLRAAGLSLRAIGMQLGRSKNQVQRMLTAEYEELTFTTLKYAGAALGEELDRLDGLERAARAILADKNATVAEELRAISGILRASETRMRLLGADRPGPFFELKPSLQEVIQRELAEMDDEQLDRELQALGGLRPSPDTEPDPQRAATDSA